MSVRRTLGVVVELLVVVALGSLVLGAALGQPVLLSYVETGSMAPTMQSGDGFVAVPAQVAGPVEEGDVVTFRAKEVQGGGLTTHRVVDETDRGLITRGDANPFTDQDGGEPPVKDAQVVAKALRVNGEVVVIPHLGTAVEGVGGALSWAQRRLAILFGTRAFLGAQGLAYLLFAASGVLYAVDVYRERTTRGRSREDARRETGRDTRLVVGAMTAALVLAATAAMVVPAGTQEYGLVSAEFDSERPTVVPAGESTTVEYPVANGGTLPVVTYLEPASEGVAVDGRRHRVAPGGTATVRVTLSAPEETGFYRRYVTEHRYLAVLPTGVIDALYGVHPWLPVVAVDALLGVPFYLLGVRLVGTARVRSRARESPSRLDRLLARR